MDQIKIYSPIKAIRIKCIDCCCHQPSEIKNCEITTCPIWPYRMGKPLKRRGRPSKISPEPQVATQEEVSNKNIAYQVV
jgi:hypothetical protein